MESNGRTFNEWLRSQLRVKKMSQRQLAMQAGVDHSTISRLLRGDRTPSLGTATKLARGLREVLDETDTTRYFGVVENATVNPVARVEYALRSDDALSEAQVRRLMESYLSLRTRSLPNGTINRGDPRPRSGRTAAHHALVRANGRPAF